MSKNIKELKWIIKLFGTFCVISVPTLVGLLPIFGAIVTGKPLLLLFLIVTIPIGMLTVNTIRIIFDSD